MGLENACARIECLSRQREYGRSLPPRFDGAAAAAALGAVSDAKLARSTWPCWKPYRNLTGFHSGSIETTAA